MSENLPWTAFAGYVLSVGSRKGDQLNSLRERVRHKNFGSLGLITNVKHTVINAVV